MISLQDVSKVYKTREGEVRALDAVSAHVGEGEFVAVRGASGCGKSTFLITVAGMARPTEGTVLFDGDDLYSLPVGRRAAIRAQKVGFVFQMFHLVPYLTVRENVLVPTLAGAKAGNVEAEAALERLGMADRLSHRPGELSTGERQRVALARAFLHEPNVILADEPTGNLDPETGEQVLAYLKQFHESGGTVLLVTHDDLAAGYAQRTLRLDGGRLES